MPARRVRARSHETLRIGYLPITDATPLLIAHARGYFTEEGLKVAPPRRVRSWSTLSESFLTSKFNVTHLLLPIPVWMRYNNKVPVKVLAWDHTNGSALTVRGDAEIRGFADLGGKQIAVPYWYSMHNIILQMGLKKAGLTPVIQPQQADLKPDEVNLFVLSPPEMPVALSGRKIDGFIVAEPFNALGELKIGAKIMRFTGDIWKNHPCCVVVMQEEIIRAEPVFTQKVVNAIVRAQLWTIENPAEAARILSREGEGYLPTSERVLNRVFTGYDTETYGAGAVPRAIHHPEWAIRRIGFQPYPYPSATRFIVREMGQTVMEGDTAFLKKLGPDEVAADLVEDRFVKQAIDAVGGPGRFDLIDLTHPWHREEVIAL
jgi:NitT/TauT family transport system substrate-binding protein